MMRVMLAVVAAIALSGCKLQRGPSAEGPLSKEIEARIEQLRTAREQKKAKVNKKKAERWLKRACRRSSATRFNRAVGAVKYAELAEGAGWTTQAENGGACRSLTVVPVPKDETNR